MAIVYVVREEADNCWGVYRETDPTVTQLTLPAAMRVARELGRVTHVLVGATVNVVLDRGAEPVLLACYARPVPQSDTGEPLQARRLAGECR